MCSIPVTVVEQGIIGQHAEDEGEEKLMQGGELFHVGVSVALKTLAKGRRNGDSKEGVHTHCFGHLQEGA